MSKRFYLTTAIDYTNGAPHLGHAYEKVITDVIARSHRSRGESTFFLTGLDEHGQKVQQAAIADGKSPQEYCDELAQQWGAFSQLLGLSHDDFVRTTEARHFEVVQALLTKLHEAGELYKSPYKGWYSARQETFLTDKDRLPDGSFDASYGDVVELIEENWYFRMGQYQGWLLEYIETHPEFVQPSYRRNEVLGFLRHETLEDLCITRPINRLSWGIPLPFDPDYVTYVWFDALTNYFTVPASHKDPVALEVLGSYYSPATSNHTSPLELWPADLHVVGKDILKFHAVYWPIMLHAAGAPLPRQILAHGWWQKDGQKISKSTGNIVDPVAVIEEWGLDAFRYYVVRELAVGSDGNWTDTGFADRYRAELANGLGNLLNRALNMVNKYRDGIVPARDAFLEAEAVATIKLTERHMNNHSLQEALVTIWQWITRANQYVDQTQPFKMAKDPARAEELDAVLYNLLEACRLVAVLIWPFLPSTAVRMYEQLGLSHSPDQWTEATWGLMKPGNRVGQPVPLFPRKDVPSAGA
jgi:methionyl-tRNA synthetase